MGVEDEGMEPEFEVTESKKKKKNLGAGGKQVQNGNSAEVEANTLKRRKKHKRKLTNTHEPDKTGETPSDMIMQAKKKVKRNIGEIETVSPEFGEIPKKKRKLEKTQLETVQPVTPVATKRKKKLLKKKLTEGAPVEEVVGESLEELTASKSAEPQGENGDSTKEGLKKKKKKKRNPENAEPTPSCKKDVVSSLEAPLPVTEEQKAEEWKSPEEEKKKKKRQKKKIIISEQEKKDVKRSGSAKKKKKMKKKTENNGEDGEGGNIDQVKRDNPAIAENSSFNAGKYEEILERLSLIQKEVVARQKIAEDVTAGNIEESEVMMVLRLWRQRKGRKAQTENKEKLLQMDGTLEEVKKAVNDLVRKGKLKSEDAGDIIKRWKAREKRRVDRQVSKQTNRTCFNCRQPGHVLADCPNRGDGDQTIGNVATMHGEGICFKCGSTEHKIQKCPRKNVKGFPYATCFVCGQQGHLSRDCEKNANGIYPDGGSCNVCGSTKHLKRDCPELAAQKQQKDERKVTIRAMSAMSSADADDIPEEEPKEVKKKKKKIVRF